MVTSERPTQLDGVDQAQTPHEQTIIRNLSTGQFEPGTIANPYGRPRKGESYAEIAASLANRTKRTVVAAMVRRASRGDVRAAEYLTWTAEGKPATRIIVTQTDAESPLVSALQRIAQRIAASEGAVIEGESRLLPGAAEDSSVSEAR